MDSNHDIKDRTEKKEEDVVIIKEVSQNEAILRSKAAEDKLDLVQKYSDYCRMAENESLNFLTKLNHPVIPSMRDLKRIDITNIFSTFKRSKGAHEQSVSFLLLIDYLAISIENPLYSEHISILHFKNFYPDMIKKILRELKSIVMSWSTSGDLSEYKERSQAIIRYFQLLLPIFESSPDGIDKIIKNIIDTATVENKSSPDRVNNTDDENILIETPENLANEHCLNKSNQLINPSSKGKQAKSKISPTLNKFFAKSTTTQSTIKNSSSLINSSSSSPSPTKKPRLSLDENNEIEVFEIIPKQNPVPSTSSSSTNSNTLEKKKVNAFTLMMDQSRLNSKKGKEKKGLPQSKLDISKK